MRRFRGQVVSMLAGCAVALALLASAVTSGGGSHAEAQTPPLVATPTATASPAATAFAGPGSLVVPGVLISGSVPGDGGFGIVVFSGGTFEQLISASGCPASRVTFWATVGGGFVVYVPASTVAAPNASFAAAFPGRIVPAFAGLIGRCAPLTGTGVQGRVTLGPLCGPENALLPCPDRPYVATLLFLDLTGREVARLTSGEDGRYALALAAGSYTLVPLSPGSASLPRAASQRFEVLSGQVTTVDIAYDSGIRSVEQAP